MKKISTSTLQRPMVICLLAAFCCLLWGSAFPAVKIGYGLLSISSADSAEQLIFAGLRFFFAGVVTVLFHSASLRRLRLPRLRRLCRRHPGGHGSGECVRPCRRGECCRHRKDHGPGGSLR